MRYAKANIQVPYFDAAGAKQWVVINVGSSIDRRRLLRGVRKFVQENFNKRVSNAWVKMHCIITVPTIQLKNTVSVVVESKDEQRKRMDDIYMMFAKDEDENQDGTYPEAEESDPNQAGLALPVVQETPSR